MVNDTDIYDQIDSYVEAGFIRSNEVNVIREEFKNALEVAISYPKEGEINVGKREVLDLCEETGNVMGSLGFVKEKYTSLNTIKSSLENLLGDKDLAGALVGKINENLKVEVDKLGETIVKGSKEFQNETAVIYETLALLKRHEESYLDPTLKIPNLKTKGKSPEHILWAEIEKFKNTIPKDLKSNKELVQHVKNIEDPKNPLSERHTSSEKSLQFFRLQGFGSSGISGGQGEDLSSSIGYLSSINELIEKQVQVEKKNHKIDNPLELDEGMSM